MSAKLTKSEIKVVELVATGKSNQEIADTLVISERTARTHVSNILAKVELPSRTALTVWAIASGLVEADSDLQENSADQLSERELEIARLIANGLSDNEISAELEISNRTTRSHVSAILGKLGAFNRTEVAVWYHNAKIAA